MASSSSRKVWLGNVDPRVSEYQLLKAASAFGRIETFDFVYGVDGAGRRVPKGFAFVTFAANIAAEKAIAGLDGVRIGDRRIVAK
jgi:RNA recognition motif-containing protein